MFLENKPDKLRLRNRLTWRDPALNAATREIREATRKREYQKGWRRFEEVQLSKIPIDGPLYDAAFNLCSKAVWYDRGLELWQGIPEHHKTIVSYSTMIDLCAKCKRVHEAEALFASMQERGIQPNIITYIAI